MAALAWLLIPLVAAIGAGLWGSWANRTRKVRGRRPRARRLRPLPRGHGEAPLRHHDRRTAHGRTGPTVR